MTAKIKPLIALHIHSNETFWLGCFNHIARNINHKYLSTRCFRMNFMLYNAMRFAPFWNKNIIKMRCHLSIPGNLMWMTEQYYRFEMGKCPFETRHEGRKINSSIGLIDLLGLNSVLLENNINYILWFYLTDLVIGLRWFFDMVSELWWSSGHEIESYHPYIFDKH
jgi:hypothetical protein